MLYNDAMDIIGGLSTPSKMPWFSWSISASKCITGSKLRKVEGSVCSDCYACKGQYNFKVVKDAHERRLQGLSHPDFVEAFVLVLTKLHERTRSKRIDNGIEVKENRFRWHDAGDLQDVEHLRKINQIAEQTPQLIHWLPTREYGIVNQFMKIEKFAPNLIVRPSATMIGEMPHKQPMGLAFSTVGVQDPQMTQCPAAAQQNQCKDCSQCWDSNKNINYAHH